MRHILNEEDLLCFSTVDIAEEQTYYMQKYRNSQKQY